MRKIVATLLVLAATLTLFNCKPDPKALEQARQEGIQKGYDSALAIFQNQMDSAILPLMPNKLLWDDFRTYAHTHTESFVMDPANPTEVQWGILAYVEAGMHTHQGKNSHVVKERIVFLNTKKLKKAQLEKAHLDSHQAHTLTSKTAEVILPGPGNRKVIIAYDVEVN